MVHSSILDPRGEPTPAATIGAALNGGKVRVLMRAPFQYAYGKKSFWVTTGEWMVLDPIKDKEEILYLDSPSNPYRQFIHMEGQAQVGVAEEKGGAYSYGTGYQQPEPQPMPRSNALLPPQEPEENPHILETLAKAGLRPTPVPITAPMVEELVPPVPTGNADLPMYGEPIEPNATPEAMLVEGISNDIPSPTPQEMREAELRAMKVPALKTLASSMGLEYKDKESIIREILGASK
jgi:hypothetical protein